jgi:hypothetical protein
MLANAMTPDELSEEPRKASWMRVMVALACVIAIALVALLATAPTPRPVSVWFVGYTNSNGHIKLVFQGTNGTPRDIRYLAGVSTNRAAHAKTIAGSGPYLDLTGGNASASGIFSFSLDAPTEGTPWHVMWYFTENPRAPTPWERLRGQCSAFFKKHGMPKFARRFWSGPDLHYIDGG